MRRILYVHHGGAIGGAPLSLLGLLKHLDRTRYEPIVLVLRPGPVVARFEAAGVETRVARDITDFSHTELEWYGGADLWRLPLQLARFGPSVRATRRYLRELAPDLVHLNSSTLAASARASRREGIPVVWHIREPIARGYVGLRQRWLTRRIERDATRIIAISAHDAGRLRPSAKIRVIPNGVDFAMFDRHLCADAARGSLHLPPDGRVVTMLGGVAAPKGTLTFVEALRLLRDRHPDVTFLVAGPPPITGHPRPLRALAWRMLRVDAYARRVNAAAADLVAAGHLRFVGVRSDVPQILAAADVLAFPATVPHFGRPLIEAGAMAKPVVASRLGPILELVRDGVTGLLVPPCDPTALAEAILALLEDPVRARRMGEAGYEQARERFDAATVAGRTFDVYREVLG